MSASHGARRLTGNCEHGHVVELRVIKAGDQMGCSWTSCGETDAQLA